MERINVSCIRNYSLHLSLSISLSLSFPLPLSLSPHLSFLDTPARNLQRTLLHQKELRDIYQTQTSTYKHSREINSLYTLLGVFLWIRQIMLFNMHWPCKTHYFSFIIFYGFCSLDSLSTLIMGSKLLSI